MDTLLHDLRYGVRVLLKSPGFTAVAVLALALGIGANTAIFSVVNAILLRPLPFDDPDKLMVISEWSQQVPNMSVSFANFNDFRDQNQVFDSLFAFRSQNFILTGEDEPERLQGRQVTVGIFETLRVHPILGRVFSPAEDIPGAERVALLGEGFWNRRFARDRGVVGKTLVLNGEPHTVIGVMPAHFRVFAQQTDIWTALGRLEDQLGGPNNRGNHPGIYVIARCKAGVSEERARAEMIGIATRLAQQYPNTNANQSATLRSLHESFVGNLRPALLVLLAAVAFVLLIACANVGNLLLARATARQKEIAVRTALGAGRRRLLRQLLTESLLLAVVGGTLGLLFAYGGVKGLVAITPANTPRIQEVAIDGTALAFTFVVSVVTGLIFGLAPALQASRPEINETLKEGTRGSAGAGRHRVRSLLVVAETSLALVLLVGAGLMLKSFLQLLHADSGFRPEGVLTLQISLPQTKYIEPAKSRAFFQQALQNVKSLPGVEIVGSSAPLLGGWQTSFSIAGRPDPPPGQVPSTDIARVSSDFFQTMGVRLLKGRYFTERDADGTLPVCIVDETMANAYWPNEDPVGKQMRLGGRSPQNKAPWLTVVGVVAHVKNYGVDQDSRVETYLPYLQNPLGFATLVLRARIDPASMTSAVRTAIRAVDPEVPVYGVRLLDEIVADNTAPRRLAALMLGLFAVVALILAAVGLYGVMSYSVTQRTHEIGIRMALGAQRRDVVRLVVGQGLALAVIGVAVGLAAAFALTRFISTLLFRVNATDPVTFGAISLLLSLVAVLASYLPARRATHVDPLVALRYE
jgi:putative ABC transport system permease protein